MLKESGFMCRRDTELDLLRFLRARSFDVGKARAMYETMVEWRQEIGADTIKEVRFWLQFREIGSNSIYDRSAHDYLPSLSV